MTVSSLLDLRTAWSPCREVMVPRRRTVVMLGWVEGAKAWRWEGRMRGVGMDIVFLGGGFIGEGGGGSVGF